MKAEGISIARLEKHLSDVRRKQPDLSRDVAAELRKSELTIGSELPPEEQARLREMLTSLNYEQRARFVRNIEASLKGLSLMLRA